MNEFTNDQVAELRTLEKVRVRRGGSGFRQDVQELINRLKDGGVGAPDTADPFLVQSKVLWDKGWGRELQIKTLDEYRNSLQTAGLVAKPERPTDLPDHLNRLVLWDRRPLLIKQDGKEHVSLVKACHLLGVFFSGTDDTLIQHEETPEITDPVRWVWCHDGRKNRGKAPRDCRTDFTRPEVGLEAIGGLFLYAQDQTVIGGGGSERHIIDLPGSVRRDSPERCAYLGHWRDEVGLRWDWDGYADPGYGSGSRWGVGA